MLVRRAIAVRWAACPADASLRTAPYRVPAQSRPARRRAPPGADAVPFVAHDGGGKGGSEGGSARPDLL